jgi:hypothetical protein
MSPPATGSRSKSVTDALVCNRRSWTAYIPAGPVPTTATAMGARSLGTRRLNVGGPHAWKFGDESMSGSTEPA